MWTVGRETHESYENVEMYQLRYLRVERRTIEAIVNFRKRNLHFSCHIRTFILVGHVWETLIHAS